MTAAMLRVMKKINISHIPNGYVKTDHQNVVMTLVEKCVGEKSMWRFILNCTKRKMNPQA
jgi:penicillin V acylase-like amidase (Ntn superfamily)